MHARIVTFRLTGITADEYEHLAASAAPAFADWPGLQAKVWIADEDGGTYGGIYLFADRAAADRSRDTDLFQAMAANPAFADLTIRELAVLDLPTAVTTPAALRESAQV